MRAWAVGVGVAVGLMAGVGADGLAQTGNRVVKGTVTDSASGKPVSGATIYVNGTATEERSAKDGGFVFQASQAELVLAVRRPGYVPVVVRVPAGAAGSEADLGVTRIRPSKTEADQAAIQAVDLQLYPRLASFYERKAKYRQGAFLTPDDLQRSGGVLTDMIRQKQGFRNMCVDGRQGELDCGKKSDRGPTTIMGSGRSGSEEQQLCLTRIWTDDVGPERSLDEIRVDEVLAVEAYPSPHTTPPDFPGSPCVTIRLWMKKARL